MSHIGKIAKIKSDEFTREELPSGVKAASSDSFYLCKDIDLTYPVLGSLKVGGRPILTSSVGIIISSHSRPNSFQSGPLWKDYNILSVYIEGDVYKCFEVSLDFITS